MQLHQRARPFELGPRRIAPLQQHIAHPFSVNFIRPERLINAIYGELNEAVAQGRREQNIGVENGRVHRS